MFKLEEKFKNHYGEDYFPYYVGTLAAIMTYNYNDLLCNVILFKEKEFLAEDIFYFIEGSLSAYYLNNELLCG